MKEASYCPPLPASKDYMVNHEQIKGTEEIHVLEDKVSLLFHSQLIGQMKHQYSTGSE